MDDDKRREQISAALDHEAAMPDDLTPDEQRFVDDARALRSRFRIGDAGRLPDVSEAVLQRLPAARRPHRDRLVLVAAAAFVLAALAGVLAVRPGGPVAPRPAAAEIAERVLAGQRSIETFDATLTVVEYGVHPDVAERTLTGTVHYEAPEHLRLHLAQQSPVASGWPANDIDLVLGPGTADLRGLDGCPVDAQPACLRPARHRVDDLAPFSPTWVSPLDLIVPTDAFLPEIPTPTSEQDGIVAIETTVARIDRLIDGLTSAGAIRSVHATDRVRLELDAETLTLRELTITAADNLARSTWASTNGYDDPPGTSVLTITLAPTNGPADTEPELIEDSRDADVSAGFTDTPLDPPWAAPAGFSLYRTGVLADGGPRTEVYAYSDGRAWIRIDTTDRWDPPQLFGSLGPVVRSLPVGSGTGYTDPTGSAISLHRPDRDVVVTGSVDLATLTAAAAKTIDGVPIDTDWIQGTRLTELPSGALAPPSDHIAVADDDDVIIAVGGPGSTGLVLTQSLATTLPPPPKGDVVEAIARGVPARYSPTLGTLTWLEDGWQRELRGEGLSLADLQTAADELIER